MPGPVQEEAPAPAGCPPGAIVTRMRRRVARVGVLVALLSTLAAALVVFAACACKSVR
jgi:hypothetical protein